MSPSKKHIPINDLVSLVGKRAIITGAAEGIGQAIALRLAEAGAVVAVVDVNEEKALQATQELIDLGYKAHCIRCDVSNEDDVRNMVDRVVAEMGGVEILVNNAGIYPYKKIEQMSQAEFEKVTSVNLTGTFMCSREVSLRMRDQKSGGSIINIASVDAIRPSSPGLSAYDASKGGVVMLTRSLALELGIYDIRVNAIAPGVIMTKHAFSTDAGLAGDRAVKEFKKILGRIVLGRGGKPDEIGRVALFLASDLASYMTGSTVLVDGGYLLS